MIDMTKIISQTKSNLNLFFGRKQLKKIIFITKCYTIINQKMTFEQALVELPEFLEIVEINHGLNEILIDNRFGKFHACWDSIGKNLTYYKLKTVKSSY